MIKYLLIILISGLTGLIAGMTMLYFPVLFILVAYSGMELPSYLNPCIVIFLIFTTIVGIIYGVKN